MNSKHRATTGVALGMFAALALAGSAAATDPADGCVRQDSGYAAQGVACPPTVTPPPGSDVLGAEPNVTAARFDVLSATGWNVAPVLLLAGGLVVVGAGALGAIAVVRRRRTV